METHFTTHAESRTDAVQILITDPIEATGVVTDAGAATCVFLDVCVVSPPTRGLGPKAQPPPPSREAERGCSLW